MAGKVLRIFFMSVLYLFVFFIIAHEFLRYNGYLIFKIIKGLNLQVQEFNFIVNDGIGYIHLSLGKLILIDAQIEAGEVAISVSLQIDIIGQLRILNGFLLNLDLILQVFQVPDQDRMPTSISVRSTSY